MAAPPNKQTSKQKINGTTGQKGGGGGGGGGGGT